MRFRPADGSDWRATYRLLTSLVVPRPIAWVSSCDAQGNKNLAPFSFFNVVCAQPPTIVFCPMLSGREGLEKDTLANIRETKEFVVHVVSRNLVEAMNISACEVDSTVDEFSLAGLESLPSVTVKPPRLAQAKAWLECRLSEIITVGQGSGSGSMILGEVLLFEVHPDCFENDKVLLEHLDPVGRLDGSSYCGLNDKFELERVLPEELSVPGRKA